MEGLYISLSTCGLTFFILGMIFLIFGLRRTRPKQNWVKTSGVIVQKEKNIVITLGKILRNEGFTENIPDQYPTVEYEINGKTYSNTSTVSQTPGFRPGKEVEVLYNPTNHEEAVINTSIQRGSFFVILGSIFLVVFCISLSGLLAIYLLNN